MWLGGIIRDDTVNTESGVPYLSDLPLIGWLFGSDSSSDIKTTLFFFCTPRILEDFEELDDLSAKGKARAANTIGLARVRMIDEEFELENPVDVILSQDANKDGETDKASLNLPAFAAPSYPSSGEVIENVEAPALIAPQ